MAVESDVRRSFRILEETLSYVLFYAPDFPAEDQTCTEEQFGRMLQCIDILSGATRNAHGRQWLDLARREVNEARERFLSGEEDDGRRMIQAAQEYMKNWTKKKRVAATFSAGPDGTVERQH